VLSSLICSVLSSYFEGNISANLVQPQRKSLPAKRSARAHPSKGTKIPIQTPSTFLFSLSSGVAFKLNYLSMPQQSAN
ncbi:hypothetical protein, partial [Eikenella corrodens]|uniref:hypothetical protein n=1 Tax=Eikenella corrodens TaxID=539 RepID=UPI001959795B